mmetsp:Transcript_22047/g.74175  ORF Transcript_22047/g.74175 Transcript_22047/m.74175 type:complete len:223 (+) Transcript_22047:304-972(+)
MHREQGPQPSTAIMAPSGCNSGRATRQAAPFHAVCSHFRAQPRRGGSLVGVEVLDDFLDALVGRGGVMLLEDGLEVLGLGIDLRLRGEAELLGEALEELLLLLLEVHRLLGLLLVVEDAEGPPRGAQEGRRCREARRGDGRAREGEHLAREHCAAPTCRAAASCRIRSPRAPLIPTRVSAGQVGPRARGPRAGRGGSGFSLSLRPALACTRTVSPAAGPTGR